MAVPVLGQAITFNLANGQFTSGPLANTGITGFIEIDPMGATSGLATKFDPLVSPGQPVLTQITWVLLRDAQPDLTFDLDDDFAPAVGFNRNPSDSLASIDYFGELFLLPGNPTLEVSYNGLGNVGVTYTDGSGEVSTGTLTPPAVPEPSGLPLLFAGAVLLAVHRRR
ncbi:MAG: PEP-CTERM sorting domain-containing protein [Opitutales bacterium]